MIDENFIQQLKISCDITSVVSDYAVLKRDGRNQKCLCPFHLEKTPSCVVYQETQSFYCFGCGAGGDVITFIMKIENLDYVEAVRFLAEKNGISMPEDSYDQIAQQKRRIYEMNRLAAKFYYSMLKQPEGRNGLLYFSKRGLPQSIVVKFGLGYAPNQWNSLRDYLRAKGYTYEEMETADLVVQSKNGSFYDKFRNRAIFPIIDIRGNVIAFGGRVLDDSKPKYLNSSDTLVFKKSRHLFALNFAKSSEDKALILGEGYMDVIAMHKAGFDNAVATLGTSLTAEQARLLSRYSKDIIIAYDADEAGKKATKRASKLLQEAGVDPRVLSINNAKDPDEYIKKFGSGRFKVLLEQADSLVLSEKKEIRNKYDLNNPESQRKYINENCEIIAQMYDPLQREIYIGDLARETGVSRDILENHISHMRKRKLRQNKKQEWKNIQRQQRFYRDKINPAREKYPRAAAAEEGIIHYLFCNPDQYQLIAASIKLSDFITDWGKRLYSSCMDFLETGKTLDISSFHQSFEQEEIGRIASIVNSDEKYPITQKALRDYITVLKEESSKLNEDAQKSLSREAFEEYYKEQVKRKN